MAFAPHLSKLLLPIPLAPVLDRRSGIRTDATTNSKACSSSHLTSKMTYSRVIAVTRTAVLIKEGSVFCIALKKKPISSHVGKKTTGDFRQTDKSLSKRAEQSQNGNSMDSPSRRRICSPISIDSGNDELQMLFHKSSSLFAKGKVKEVFSDLLLLHGSLVLGGSRRNLCVFEEDATGEMKAEFVISPPSHMFNLFLAVSPEIFLINATFILLIHGVFFSTSKKDDYPPLVSNAHESERYVECATDTTLRRYLCRETCTCGSGRAFLRYLITLLLLAAGAPLLTIAHFFWNHFFRKDNLTYFCQILPLLSTAGTISMCFDFPNNLMLLNPLY
ncbi:hypothetical protein IEQ34_025071 [Dendrobium chrysotoxum]|uniref:Uncharacterized protein n=1 Tax=Dendrobium chrysotoxum TaxID=161865 RepID=A0AAV7FRA8_DENCH|nr:hypothetical protein IEQ34_025071 [Dendrobium chrysotoxum]